MTVDATRRRPAVLLAGGIAFVVLAALAAAVASRPLVADDQWMQIAVGREALRTLSIPDVDHFTFTYEGIRYVEWEWLSGVLFALVHDHFGAIGLGLFRLAVLSATVAVVARAMRRFVPSLVDPAVLAVLFCVTTTLLLRVGIRPHNLGLLLFASMLLLGPSLAANPAWPRQVAVGSIFVLWAQLHPSFVLGSVTLAVGIVDGTRGQGSLRRALERYAPLLGTLGVAALSVPGGARYYAKLSAMSDSPASTEWLPYLDHLGHDHPWFYTFGILVLAFALSVALDRSAWRRLETWLAVIVVVLAFRHVRMISEASVLVAPTLARALGARAEATGDEAPFRPGRLAVVLGLGLVLTLWVLLEIRSGTGAPLYGVDLDTNPVHQARFLVRHRLGGRVFAPTRGANAYLSFAAAPAVKTAFDGRTPQLFPVSFCDDLGRPRSATEFTSLARRMRFDWVVIPGPLFDAEARRWGRTLEASPDFELVSFDAHGLLFGRRGGERGRCGPDCAPYVALAPWRMGAGWASERLATQPAARLVDELERLSRVPDGAAIARGAALDLLDQPGLEAASRERLSRLVGAAPRASGGSR